MPAVFCLLRVIYVDIFLPFGAGAIQVYASPPGDVATYRRSTLAALFNLRAKGCPHGRGGSECASRYTFSRCVYFPTSLLPASCDRLEQTAEGRALSLFEVSPRPTSHSAMLFVEMGMQLIDLEREDPLAPGAQATSDTFPASRTTRWLSAALKQRQIFEDWAGGGVVHHWG